MKIELAECSKTSANKIQMPGITQKKECNIQNMAKVGNPVLPVCSIYFKFLIHSDFAVLH
jgi:hypothetical protein